MISLKKKQKEELPEFYDIGNMIARAPNAYYYMCYGMRSNGKTFQVLKIMLFGYHDKKRGIDFPGYLDDGSQGGIARRFREDFQGGLAMKYWDGFINNPYLGNLIEKKTNGKWNSIKYFQRAFYLEYIDINDEKNNRVDPTPFCGTFALSEADRIKGGQYPKMRYLLIDEFISRDVYLPNEFSSYVTSLISTIVRKEAKLRIFLCGNSVNKYCPYFNEMGLYKVKNQEKGTIDVYKYGETGLEVAVEYCDAPSKKNASDVYFAFNNPKLKMITEGDWEIAVYPHLPNDYCKGNILYNYFIVFDGEIMHCEVIYTDIKGDSPKLFTYVHRKTTEIKDDGISLIYSQDYSPLMNHSRKINHPRNELEKKLWWFYQTDNVYYQDNTLGEVMRNYLMWCNQESFIRK